MIAKIKLLTTILTSLAAIEVYSQTNVFPTTGVTMLNNGAGYSKGKWKTAAIIQVNDTYNPSSEFTNNRDMRFLQYGDGAFFGNGISWNLAPQTDNTFTAGYWSTQQFLLTSLGSELSLLGSAVNAGNATPRIALSNIMTWKGNGSVGIGTTNPFGKLEVSLAAEGGGRLVIASNPNDNKIYLEGFNKDANASASEMLITGYLGSNLPQFSVYADKTYITGNVGIGTSNPTHKLSVNGSIRAKEIVVNTGWSDFVFDNNYKLRPLTEVEQFVKTNKHLPEIPSQKEVEKNGVQLGDISSKLLMKIEELTLYVIEMKKENKLQQKAIEILQKENAALKTIITNPKN